MFSGGRGKGNSFGDLFEGMVNVGMVVGWLAALCVSVDYLSANILLVERVNLA